MNTMSSVQFNVGLLEMASSNLLQVPQTGEPGPEWTRDRSQGVSEVSEQVVDEEETQEATHKHERRGSSSIAEQTV